MRSWKKWIEVRYRKGIGKVRYRKGIGKDPRVGHSILMEGVMFEYNAGKVKIPERRDFFVGRRSKEAVHGLLEKLWKLVEIS